LSRQVLPRPCSLVKTVRDPPSTTRAASSVLCLTNGHLVGRITDSRFYHNNLVCARHDSSCVPHSVRASLACSNNLHAATSSGYTDDVAVIVLAWVPSIFSYEERSSVRRSTAFHVSSMVTDLVTGNGNSLAA
jgi:hypothetical protein